VPMRLALVQIDTSAGVSADADATEERPEAARP
jgi:hypothetical protein